MAGPAYESYRIACLDRAAAATRFRLPRAEILSFKEGSSAARWMQVRLIPSHKDSSDRQELSFPQLKLVAPDQRKQLTDKFLHTDEMSFVQFYLSLFNKRK